MNLVESENLATEAKIVGIAKQKKYKVRLIVGIKGGEKELLTLIKPEAELFIDDANAIDLNNLSKFKTKETNDMAFVFFYDPTHTVSELDQLHIEFMYQSSLSVYKDAGVIANEVVTESISQVC